MSGYARRRERIVRGRRDDDDECETKTKKKRKKAERSHEMKGETPSPTSGARA